MLELVFSEALREYAHDTMSIPCKCNSCLSLDTPHFYNYETLKHAAINGKITVECPVMPYADVYIEDLLGFDTSLRKIFENQKRPVNDRVRIAYSVARGMENMWAMIQNYVTKEMRTGKRKYKIEVFAGPTPFDRRVKKVNPAELRTIDLYILLIDADLDYADREKIIQFLDEIERKWNIRSFTVLKDHNQYFNPHALDEHGRYQKFAEDLSRVTYLIEDAQRHNFWPYFKDAIDEFFENGVRIRRKSR